MVPCKGEKFVSIVWWSELETVVAKADSYSSVILGTSEEFETKFVEQFHLASRFGSEMAHCKQVF